MTFAPSNSLGAYLIINQRFSEDYEVFLTQITKINSDISRAVNLRDIAIYDKVESINGQQWFNPANAQLKRSGFRQAYSLPATAAGATSTIPHNITGVGTSTTFTYIGGTCVTDAPDNRPIPFASATLVTDQIQILVNGANIVVKNGATAPNITSGYIVLDYLKN